MAGAFCIMVNPLGRAPQHKCTNSAQTTTACYDQASAIVCRVFDDIISGISLTKVRMHYRMIEFFNNR